ncbi:MAG TPA: CDP-diacylglycerol--serine O-phosphatidyltransferase [Gemmatimonadaceae bacterium]|nr:CDP-diacylglycerol--serine O-phosphatidyltransferase [Gemmatimonadaceae bacterium]
MKPPERRRRVRRAVVVLPNGFTLANLFLGVFAIVTASRGDFSTAGVYIVLGGIADALDGRIARATRTGSRFGEELDSLVDAITFGLAPALIMYFAVLNREGWDWVLVFLYSACAVIRLARFNVEQAGRAKRYFHGLPSPAAGMTLAPYYWFSQTNLYTQTMIGDLPWQVMLRYVMAGLAFLMISNVSYPAVPTVGYKSARELAGTGIVLGTILGILFLPREFFFPALMMYVLYGVAKTALFGFLGRHASGDHPVIDDDDQDDMDTVTVERGIARRRRRRRHRPERRPPTEEPGE